MVPKATPAKRRITILILSLLIPSTHKNRKKSRSDFSTDTFKNACLMSLMSPTLFEQNLIKISINFGSKFSPAFRHSFKDGPSIDDEAS